jgi:hypothetical protein
MLGWNAVIVASGQPVRSWGDQVGRLIDCAGSDDPALLVQVVAEGNLSGVRASKYVTGKNSMQ